MQECTLECFSLMKTLLEMYENLVHINPKYVHASYNLFTINCTHFKPDTKFMKENYYNYMCIELGSFFY